MSADGGTVEDFRRSQVEQEQVCRIYQMKEQLEDVDTCVLDQERLDSLGVAIGHPLDVDDKGTWDLGTTFFQPWVPSEVLAEVAAGSIWWDKLLSEHSPAEWEYASYKTEWFTMSLKHLYEMDRDLWEPWHVDLTQINLGTGLQLPFYREGTIDRDVQLQYQPEGAYFPVDETKPHVCCCVGDSTEDPGDQVLRSDVDYAIALVSFRLRMGRHTGHHTKPGLIYTFERDEFARITQVHFDGKTNKLVLRQSRQLDLRGPEPTADAFLLLRWMANRPIGETEYVDEAEPEKEEATTPDRPNTAPKLLLGCA
ncbi:hypothetical protein C8A01DRAFT_50316 [Parachaetomium inaequale]|uniref:Uncharacterized protein n=1 Tax=Parachaetomium inaequale TaxID=2588326 RepID=A0AAN6SMQ9_9PEZI|nr:hypothetical protein C8A01DRAFT_50316 [Parachaetomium inaequale]